MQSDLNLVQAFQSGDRDAFAQLIGKYQTYVASIAYSSTGDFARSEDLTQQTFLTAWQKHDQLQDPKRMQAWLRGIVKNLSRNDYRKRAADRAGQQELQATASTAEHHTPLVKCITREQSEILWAILEEIPETYREPLILFYREGNSVAKVAELMELSEDAVKQRLARGRKLVKSEIANFVEETLFDTRPDQRLTASVMAALPAAGASYAAKTGGAAAGGLLGTKSLALLAGPLIGIAGAYIGSKAAIDSATSDEERSFLKKMVAWSILVATAFSGFMCLAGFFVPGWFNNVWIQLTVGVIYTGLLFVMIKWCNSRLAEIKEKHDTKSDRQQRHEALAQTVSVNGLRWNAIGMAIGTSSFVILMSGITRDWIFLALAIAMLGAMIRFIWTNAHRYNTAPAQIRFNAICVLALIVGLSILLFLRLDYWLEATRYPTEISGWMVGGGLLAFGVMLFLILLRRADKIELEINAGP